MTVKEWADLISAAATLGARDGALARFPGLLFRPRSRAAVSAHFGVKGARARFLKSAYDSGWFLVTGRLTTT